VTGLQVDGDVEHGQPFNVTSTLLREVGTAISELLREVGEHAGSDDETWREMWGPFLSVMAQPYAGVAVRPGRRGHSEDFFRQVAEGYADALKEDPHHPFTWLARRLFRSESQTRRLVKSARQRHPELFGDEGQEAVTDDEGGRP